jgi:hypothetical protein
MSSMLVPSLWVQEIQWSPQVHSVIRLKNDRAALVIILIQVMAFMDLLFNALNKIVNSMGLVILIGKIGRENRTIRSLS